MKYIVRMCHKQIENEINGEFRQIWLDIYLKIVVFVNLKFWKSKLMLEMFSKRTFFNFDIFSISYLKRSSDNLSSWMKSSSISNIYRTSSNQDRGSSFQYINGSTRREDPQSSSFLSGYRRSSEHNSYSTSPQNNQYSSPALTCSKVKV